MTSEDDIPGGSDAKTPEIRVEELQIGPASKRKTE
jgi:hypothetical protein